MTNQPYACFGAKRDERADCQSKATRFSSAMLAGGKATAEKRLLRSRAGHGNRWPAPRRVAVVEKQSAAEHHSA